MNQEQFTEQSHIPRALIDAVVDQIGGWEYFTECAPDIANHGINGGFNGFIYYTDTIRFANENITELLAFGKDQAQQFDMSGVYSLVASFGCLPDLNTDDVAEAVHDASHEEYEQVMNALAWYAAEEVSRSYVDLLAQ